jgi:hypothetical protein
MWAVLPQSEDTDTAGHGQSHGIGWVAPAVVAAEGAFMRKEPSAHRLGAHTHCILLLNLEDCFTRTVY